MNKKDKLRNFVKDFEKLVILHGFESAFVFENETAHHFDFGVDSDEEYLFIMKKEKCPWCSGDRHE